MLAALSGTRRIGTSVAGALRALEELDCDSDRLHGAGTDELSAYLQDDRPVIAFLRMDVLDTACTGRHAVVVCGLTTDHVEYADPEVGCFRTLPLELFAAAWQAHQGEGIAILEVGT